MHGTASEMKRYFDQNSTKNYRFEKKIGVGHRFHARSTYWIDEIMSNFENDYKWYDNDPNQQICYRQ